MRPRNRPADDRESPEPTLSRRKAVTGLAVGTIASLAGCTGLLDLERKETTLEREFDATDIDRLQVTEATDDVAIEPATDRTLRARIHKRAVGQTELSDLEFHSATSGSRLRLRTEKPTVLGIGGGGIDLELAVPESVRVERVETSDGDVALRGTTGSTTVRSGDGDLTATGVSGALEVHTDDGDVDLSDVDGPVTARTADGVIHLSDVTGAVDARTEDGDVAIQNPGSIETVRTDDGDVHADVPTVAAQSTIRSADGDVAVRLATSLDAVLEATTDDGEITVSDGIGTLEAVSETRVKITVGDGDKKLLVHTTDGDVTLN